MSIDNYEAIVAKMAKLEIHNVFPVGIFRNAEGKFEKRPLERWKEFQFRSPTREEAKRMMRKHGYVYAGGIPTGGRFFVIDWDNLEACEYLEKRGMPDTWHVRTRKGGHYYFRTLQDFIVRNSASKIYSGVDVRGLGGYIVSPHSSFQIGERFSDRFVYRWDQGRSPADVPLADPPDWLFNELSEIEVRKKATSTVAPKRYQGRTSAWARKAFELEINRLVSAADGQRNIIAFEVARRLGQLARAGELDQRVVIEVMHQIANAWPNVAKTRDTIARAFEIGLGQPHQRPIRSTVASNQMTI